ncbi:MAG TPA: glycosyltransferase family 4 protein [Dictyoglomaceae bacterium]|nr:glycosyltransferase family 4 protein [Dictyoglomaceae bacterium]
MLALKEQGVDLLIAPRNPTKEIFHKDGYLLKESTIWLPLINIKMFLIFFLYLILKPRLWIVIWKIFRNSRNFRMLIKNLVVLPKSIYLLKFLKGKDIQHIHAHWGSTTATMAYIISQLTGISWSFTLHRWDIRENNMLKEKVNTAKFVRCISKHGRDELFSIIGNRFKEKIRVIHMGVKVPKEIKEYLIDGDFLTIVTPANLVETKGHKYLIEACSILIKKGIKNLRVIFYGEGPLRRELEDLIKEKNLENYIEMPGVIPYENLLEIYRNRKVNIVILPSVITEDYEFEGIPVALMEAMAYGIPIISTNTGGIPELIGDGSGIMVEEKNAEAIVDALERLIKDKDYRYEIGRKGRLKVEKEFDIEKNVKALIELIKE